MWNRFAPRMRKAVTTALEEAGRCGRDEASPEDLFVAMAKDPACAAVFMFDHAGIRTAELAETISRNANTQMPARQRASRLSPAALHVLDVAVGEADRHHHAHVGTEHVALALAQINSFAAAGALHERG